MLILNTTVTFKYEYYLFLQQTARHTTPKKYFRILKKVFEKLNLIHALRKLPGKSVLKLNSSACQKYEYGHLCHWYIKLTLFKRF